jgi:hypothetical protein
MTISCELHHIHRTRRSSLPLTFSCVGISKPISKESNSGLQINFVQESEKFWTKSALTFLKRFFGSGSTDWTDALQHCSIAALQHCSIAALQHCSIAALQQMESMWNEVNNDSLSYS